MRKIVITGASGLLGTELIDTIIENSDDLLFLVSTHANTLKKKYDNIQRIVCLDIEEFENIKQNYDCLLHLAFARSKDSEQLASSLDFTEQIINIAKKKNVQSYINISSQSIYGDINEPLWKEDASAAPTSLYALGKYATEKMTRIAFNGTDVNWTTIRLASICENARFVNVFVKNMMAGQPITIIGGSQMCSFIDVRDVAVALYRVIEASDNYKLREVYNLGTGTQTSIVEIANAVNRIGHLEYKLPEIEIVINPQDVKLNAGMDNSLFCRDFNWTPTYSMDDMIRSLFELNLEGGKNS